MTEFEKTPPTRSNVSKDNSGEALVAAMKASPHRDLNIEPLCSSMSVRDVDLSTSNPQPGANMPAAFRAAAGSPNRIRQVGAVLVTQDLTEITSCNTFPSGVRDLAERHEGDGRFVWMEHAERHAIFEAARRGLATGGGHLTTTFFPCIDCARAIVDSGIKCLDTPAPAFSDPVWGPSFERSQIILQEGGVEIRVVDENETGIS